MSFDFKTLSNGDGKTWMIEWTKNLKGEESINFSFGNDTVINSDVLDAIRKHGAWHLYCGDRWAGGDLSVFKPVAEIVKKISLPSEKSARIIGLDCLTNLETMSVGGDVSEVDFTTFTKLRSLCVNERSKGGNWYLCESLDDLLIDVNWANLKKPNALKKLRSLSIGRGLKSFEGITDLPALRELRVGGCHLPSLESLGKVPTLRLLLLNLMPKLQSLKGVEALPNLEELDVTQCGGLRDVSSISKLSKLKRLELAFCPNIRSLKGINLPRGCKVDFVTKGKVSDGF